MASRLPDVARAAFVWAGLAAISLIALLAGAHFVAVLGAALTTLHDPVVINALLVLVLGAIAAVALLAGGWLLASRGGIELRVALLGGLVLLIVVRVIIDLAIDARLKGESIWYDQMARADLAGSCCFSERSPGYPLLLAGAYAIFGPTASAGELLNLSLALLAGIALFVLVKRHAGAPAAVIALYLFALWPAGALFANVRFTETLYILLLLLGALAALGGAGGRSAALAGALIAAAQYVRPSTLALLPVYAIARWWPGVSVRNALVRTVLPMATAVVVTLAPVVVYNWQQHGEVSFATSWFGGHTMYTGSDERTGGIYSARAFAEVKALTPGGTWDDDRAAAQIVAERISRDPLLLVRLLPTKFRTLWATEGFGVYYAMSVGALTSPAGMLPTLASAMFWALITAGAAVTVFLRRRDLDRLTVLCLGLVLSVSAIHVVFEARDRLHAYVTPFLIAVAAIGLAQWAAARWSESRSMPIQEAA